MFSLNLDLKFFIGFFNYYHTTHNHVKIHAIFTHYGFQQTLLIDLIGYNKKIWGNIGRDALTNLS